MSTKTNNNHKRKDKMQSDPQTWNEKKPKKQGDEAAVSAMSMTVPFPALVAMERILLSGGPKGCRKGPSSHNRQLTLDPNTANGSLILSADKRTATYAREEQPYPQHPDRFAFWQQVLCQEPLKGRWYFQVETSGWVSVGLAYRSIRRGRVDESLLGHNGRSWTLERHGVHGATRYTFCHDQEKLLLPLGPPDAHGVGVSVDFGAGVLKFYAVSPDNEQTFLHRVKARFTEPLYPAFRLGWYDSSVTLDQLHRPGSNKLGSYNAPTR